LPFRIPNQIVAVIGAVILVPRSIGLHARRIHSEEHALAPVLERIEQQRHVVVFQHILAPRQVGANLVRMAIAADEDNIECALCMRKPDLGAFGRRLSVARRVLNKAGDVQ
jgi:hypothetical protein